MGRTLVALIISFVFCATSLALADDDWAQLFERIQSQSVIEIIIDNQWRCTGVAIRPQLYITAAHCFKHPNKDARVRDRLLGDVGPLELLGIQTDLDLALVKGQVPYKRPVHLAKSSPPVGSMVMSIGFAGQTEIPQMVSGHISRVDRLWLVLDHLFYPGYSGGPLINSKGELVGINCSVPTLWDPETKTSTDMNEGWGIPIETVRLFMALYDSGMVQ